MSLKERLEEERKKELRKVEEKKKMEGVIASKKKGSYRKELNEFLKLEKIAKENFLPILNVVREAYLEGASIFFEPTAKTFKATKKEIEFKIKVFWIEKEVPYEEGTWYEFLIITKQNLAFKLCCGSECFFESSLNNKNWKDKLENAIFSLLTSHRKECYYFFNKYQDDLDNRRP